MRNEQVTVKTIGLMYQGLKAGRGPPSRVLLFFKRGRLETGSSWEGKIEARDGELEMRKFLFGPREELGKCVVSLSGGGIGRGKS